MLNAEFSDQLLDDEKQIRQEVFMAEQGFEIEFEQLRYKAIVLVLP